MFEKIDLESILRDGDINSIDTYPDFIGHYFNDGQRNNTILRNIFSKGGSVAEFIEYDNKNIFSLLKIKELCIGYNLRFLDASYFKGEIPIEAINKIKYLEESSYQEFTKFKIIAPARRFELEDENADPLLFADLGNNQYLFIHKWGSDLNWYQKIISFPSQSYSNLAFTAIISAAILSLSIPNTWLSTVSDISFLNIYRVLFFFWMSIVALAFTVFFWLSFRKTVSIDSWDKKTE